MSSILFTSLTREQKIDFFLNCQELLVAHHPESPFIFKEDNIEERLHFFKDFAQKYKGFVYSSENLCILYNKIDLKDSRNPIEAVRSNMYKEPIENYNCYSIDWVVFRALEDVYEFVQKEYVPQIRYILWVKRGDVSVYETDKLLGELERLKKIPKIKFN